MEHFQITDPNMNNRDQPRYYTYHSLPHGTCFDKVIMADAITYKHWKLDKDWEPSLHDKVCNVIHVNRQTDILDKHDSFLSDGMITQEL